MVKSYWSVCTCKYFFYFSSFLFSRLIIWEQNYKHQKLESFVYVCCKESVSNFWCTFFFFLEYFKNKPRITKSFRFQFNFWFLQPVIKKTQWNPERKNTLCCECSRWLGRNDFPILRPRKFINYKISCALHIRLAHGLFLVKEGHKLIDLKLKHTQCGSCLYNLSATSKADGIKYSEYFIFILLTF